MESTKTQTVVITGLAQGMGRHVACMLADRGHRVAGFDVDGRGIDELENRLRHIDRHFLTPLDITDRPGILRFKDSVLDKYGMPDTVLSNVGIGFFGPFEEIDLEKALTCLEINVIGAAAVFQAFIPAMRAGGKGKLVAMSSLVGRIPFPFESVYTASKFALEGLMESMKYELAPFGITTALIEPAQVSTDFAAKIHRLPPEGSPYRRRVSRFIQRDRALIKRAPTPAAAARRIVRIIESRRPRFRNQVDAASTVFLLLNQLLPKRLRDAMLLRHMDIR